MPTKQAKKPATKPKAAPASRSQKPTVTIVQTDSPEEQRLMLLTVLWLGLIAVFLGLVVVKLYS